jgi:hypothetical protein
MKQLTATIALLILFCLQAEPNVQTVCARDNQKPINTLSEKEAGPDFPFQGEYTGNVHTNDGDLKVGLQVIARGKGAFDAKAYPGGLPGDGWNQEDTFTGKGTRDGDKVNLTGENGSGVIEDGKATIRDADGNTVGTLKKVVRKSPTLGAKPPRSGMVLFAGRDADQFVNGKVSPEGWLIQGTKSKATMQSFDLHLEFMLSYMPEARGQGRANSGCYMQSRYEVQVLDSFGLSGEHNECGGIYSVKKPDVNMCFPPLSWQTYDIQFTAAKFDDQGKKTANARMTVKHNGVTIHDDVEVPKSTTASPMKEGPQPGPLYLQDHGNQIRYRNIWYVPRGG